MNRSIPPALETLLDGSVTTFLFGAGASSDYGFPLWVELKAELASELSNNFYQEFDGQERFIEWLLSAESNQESVDQYVSEQSKSDNMFGDLFRAACAAVILRTENNRLEGGWIKQFAGKFAAYLNDLENLSDVKNVFDLTNFITLNYDRSFEALFFAHLDLEQCLSRFLVNKNDARVLSDSLVGGFKEVVHPHGVVGMLSNFEPHCGDTHASNYLSCRPDYVRYGEQRRPINPARNNILVVDEATEGSNASRDLAIEMLENSSQICVVGLSAVGLLSSELDFSLDAEVHYWTADGKPPDIDAQFHHGNAIDFANSL